MSTKPKILVVNDSVLVLSWVKYALQRKFEVETRSEAIGTGAAIVRSQPQLVLIDSDMPLLDGEDVVDCIKRSGAGRGMAMVLFSALPESDLAARAEACGADGYVQRTGDPAEFLRAVETYFEPVSPSPAATDNATATATPTRNVVPQHVVIAGEGTLTPAELEAFGPHFVTPTQVTSLPALFTVLRTSRPNLVVFGADLVDGTVSEACRFIRANPALRRLSVIHIAEADDPIRAAMIEAAGANLCLERPFEPIGLRAAVDKLLAVAARREARLLIRLRSPEEGRDLGMFGHSHDISISGMRLETTNPLAVGETLQLNFFMQDGRTEVSCDAEVVRLHDCTDRRHSYGVRLVNLLPGFRQAIARFVQTSQPGAAFA